MIKFLSRFMLFFALLLSSAATFAQEDFDLTLANEQNIGFYCPVSSTVHPTTSNLWVLMDNCYQGGYYLQAYDLFTGEPLADQTIQLDAIDGAQFGVESSVNPVTFLSDTTLEIITNAHEDYRLSRFEVNIETGEVTLNVDASQRINATLLAYTDYVEYAILSLDRQFALATGEDESYLISLASGELLKAIENPIMFAAFSTDGQFVFLTTFEDVDDYDNHNALLEIYDLTMLPDAEALQETVVPSVEVYPSPNGEYLALKINDDHIAVVSLYTEAVTPSLEIWEAPRQALTCVNSGADLSDVDFTVSGRLPLQSLHWLPDSSGFVTLNSFNGEGAGGGRPCYFSYSRLRHYQLSGG